jgi:hypothetical protein
MPWPKTTTDEYGVEHYEREPTEEEYNERAMYYARLGDFSAAFWLMQPAYSMACFRAIKNG